MKKDVTPYLISIALHAVFIFLLIFAAPLASYRLDNAEKNYQPVVHASMVNVDEVQAQVQAIQSQEQQQQAEQQQKLQELQAQAARQTKQAEEQRLVQIKQEQQKAQAEKQRIAEQMQVEQQRLAKLKLAEQQKLDAQVQAKALALKNQKDAEAKLAAEQAAKQLQTKQQADLTAKQTALQQQLMQQQMDAEKQQLLQMKLRGIIDQYRARILEAIRNQWIIPEGADPDSYCIFNIELSPSGVVIRAQLIRSSGNIALDRAAETAIHKASPLPVPPDSSAFASFQRFNLKMTPHEVT